jgi:AcrR family transcriptional regulator
VVAQQFPARARARRLAPDERRAALLEAATELFIAQGASFTTADLAAAAGVSEGTIFRYFPDKASLIQATREGALALETLLPALAEAAELPTVEARLIAAGQALSERIAQMARVMEQDEDHHHHHHDKARNELIGPLLGALAPLFDQDPGVAPGTPDQLANLYLGMLVSNTLFCDMSGTAPMAIEQLVALFVHGTSGP